MQSLTNLLLYENWNFWSTKLSPLLQVQRRVLCFFAHSARRTLPLPGIWWYMLRQLTWLTSTNWAPRMPARWVDGKEVCDACVSDGSAWCKYILCCKGKKKQVKAGGHNGGCVGINEGLGNMYMMWHCCVKQGQTPYHKFEIGFSSADFQNVKTTKEM